MRRREFITLVCAWGAWPLNVRADDQTGKIHRIGYLASASATATTRFVDAFRQGLRELGWVEGQNIVVEYRYADGKFERLPDLAAELVQLKVEVILATPTPAAVAASKATTTVPIVMRGVGDPVGLGLVSTLARPGGNVTGLSYSVGTETIGKGLELLKEAVPKVQRVAILSNPANPLRDIALSDVKDAARWLGLHLQLLEARRSEGFDAVFAAVARERAEALFVVADSVFFIHRIRLADLALNSRLPSMYGNREAVEAGGLMSYGPDFAFQFRQAAAYVDKILKGATPADLPVEQPAKFELVINLRIAKVLGLMIPPTLLARADEVIE